MTTPTPFKLYSDDVSLVMVILDTNPFFWASENSNGSALPFSQFLNHLLPFLNSILLLNQLNQVVVIASGVNSCGYIYDSSVESQTDGGRRGPALFAEVLKKLEEFVKNDCQLAKDVENVSGTVPCLLSGSLSLALCYIQRIFWSGPIHPQPRILCLQGSPDGPEQYVAVMNAIFSAQRSWVPIDSCVMGLHSAFLQQASYITGGVYLKPQQLDGLFQCLAMVFATDLQSRSFLQLPKPVGVDFRASCFCHKTTISMGFICSVCLSIFCQRHKKCSTCGSEYNQPHQDSNLVTDRKRKIAGEDLTSLEILIYDDSEEPSKWLWVTQAQNAEEFSGIDNESYVVIKEEHVIDGIANFTAKCIIANPRAKRLSPDELQKTVTRALGGMKDWNMLKSMWKAGKLIYALSTWGIALSALYSNRAIVKATARGATTSAEFIMNVL